MKPLTYVAVIFVILSGCVLTYRHTLWIDVGCGAERVVDSIAGLSVRERNLASPVAEIKSISATPLRSHWEIVSRTTAFSNHSAYYTGTAAYAILKRFEESLANRSLEEAAIVKSRLLSALLDDDLDRARSLVEKPSPSVLPLDSAHRKTRK